MTSTESGVTVESEPFCHFTYCLPKGNNLLQGDVLSKNEQLMAALKEHFPYYLRSDFTHFIILSQSCDLIRRDGNPCKTQHITLAAIRPLSLVLELELRGHQNEIEKAAMVCSDRKQFLLIQFYERLLNNNDPEYFYLHEQPELHFPESSCALLRQSISLEAQQYYDNFLDARVISLMGIFQAKLGWLVGNMYSRVGTEDWVPDHLTKEEFDDRVKKEIEALCPWIPDKQLKEAQRKAPDGLLTRDQNTIRKHIHDISVPSKKEQVIKRVVELLQGLEKVKNEEDENLIRFRLTNDPDLSVVLK